MVTPTIARAGESFALEGLHWSQLEPGRFTARGQIVEAGAVTFARLDFSLGIKAEAAAVPGRCSVGVIADNHTVARWFGNQINVDDVAVTRGILDLFTIGPSAFYSVTVDTGRLIEDFPNSKGTCALIRSGIGAQLEHDGHHARRLRQYVRAVLSTFENRPDAPLALASSIGRTLLPMLALSFEEHTGNEPTRSVTRRIAAVRLCEEYVRQNIDRSLTLYELCQISGLRLRSLINAFQAVTGMSPMAYLKRQRLNGARQSLLDGVKGRIRIIDVATNWGFWHMGHFTSDYRAMFGESPSQTLNRS